MVPFKEGLKGNVVPFKEGLKGNVVPFKEGLKGNLGSLYKLNVVESVTLIMLAFFKFHWR